MYRRVTYEDRLQMKAYFESGLTQSEVAHKLNFHKSTITRELKRNSIGGNLYRPDAAQYCTRVRQDLYRKKPRKMTHALIQIIEKKLQARWTPEMISNRLRKEGKLGVCTETIYKFIEKDKKQGGTLWRNLKYARKRRWRRFSVPRVKRGLKGETSIAEREENRQIIAANADIGRGTRCWGKVEHHAFLCLLIAEVDSILLAN